MPPPATLKSPAARKQAVAAISAADPRMALLVERVGKLAMRDPSGSHYGALARAITYQQLAGAAAAAIMRRWVDAIGGDITPEAFQATPDDALRKAGLSANKLAALRDLSAKVLDGTVPLEGIEAFADDDIVARLSTVRGIGRWTAEMFLLFELRRADVWPVDDLGVRFGWQLIQGDGAMLSPKALMPEGERFRPYRSAAAWYCWQAVHLHRGG